MLNQVVSRHMQITAVDVKKKDEKKKGSLAFRFAFAFCNFRDFPCPFSRQ